MKRLSFIPQLDSFRFFAVALVIFFHYLPTYAFLPWGHLGVNFFFVLSGYLITRNLLSLKQSIDSKEISVPYAFKSFYLRRTLRIFPLYYMVIVLLYLLARPLFEGNVGWYFAYMPNILVFVEKYWPGPLSVFWSLGVEEQFYLLWPLLIFLVRWSSIKRLFIAFIAFGIAYKIIIFLIHGSPYHYVLPWNQFDAFGVGALLAYSAVFPGQASLLKKIPFLPGFLFCSAAGIASFLLHIDCLFVPFISFASYFIIRQAEKGFTGVAGWILDLPALQYLGRISYGLYVYHTFTPWIWRCLIGTEDKYPLPITLFRYAWLANPMVNLVAQFALAVGISSLSWYLVERPFINLKNKLQPKLKPSLSA